MAIRRVKKKTDNMKKYWDLEVVGLHDPEEYPRGFDADAPLCQFGHCSGCGYAVVSWAKHAKCSVRGASVYCT